MYRAASDDPHVYQAFAGRVFAFRRADGKEAWRASLGRDGSETSLHVTADVVYAACGRAVSALAAATGEVVWTARAPFGESMNSVMLVDGDAIFLSLGGQFVCFERETGAVRWSDELPGTGYGTPTLAVRGRSSGSSRES